MIPPGAEQAELLAGGGQEDHRPPGRRPGRQRAGGGEHRHDARGVVVRAVVDRVARDRRTDPEMIVVGVDQHRLLAEPGIGAADEADDVKAPYHVFGPDRAGGECQPPGAVRRRGHGEGHALEVAAVAGGHEAVRAHLVGDETSGTGSARRRGPPPFHRVVRERAEQLAGVGQRDVSRR